MHEIFETASPTFKARFMYMAGHDDEAAFDAFAARLDLREIAADVDCPYLAIAGEDDELSPLHHTFDLLRRIPAPVDLVIYRGERHSIGAGSAAAFGPNRHHLIAGWAQDRQDGRPAVDRYRVVDATGAVADRPPSGGGERVAEPPAARPRARKRRGTMEAALIIGLLVVALSAVAIWQGGPARAFEGYAKGGDWPSACCRRSRSGSCWPG